MNVRYRTINKLGNGRYITTSRKLSDVIWVMLLYYLCIFPFIALIKYCVILPIKYLIKKIRSDKNE